tara:strand:- start:26298 stop:27305 length:1008 start_codon:yes stop_codon:yes gene_type:complete
MDSKFNVAVVGATGAVGQALLDILMEREFPINRLFALASHRTVGRIIESGTMQLEVEDLEYFDFRQVDLALFSAGGSISAQYAPKAVSAGAIVVDNTSNFRLDPEVPLIVPEVNLHALKAHRGIIANPNCSTMQMVVALKPIYDVAGIARINVATYQAVSGAGKRAIEELSQQTKAILMGEKLIADGTETQIGFNAIPHIDVFQENGYTKEEMKMVLETQKIFEDQTVLVNPTAVRIPVFYGHSEAVHIETRNPVSVSTVRAILNDSPGITVIDEQRPGGYPTAAIDGAHSDQVYVGRIRKDISSDTGINMWIVSDNIRKGAALNAVQISEHVFN